MNREKVLKFAKRYEHLIDCNLLGHQLETANERSHLISPHTINSNEDSILDLLAHLNETPVAFSELIEVVEISATLPVSTASNERFFPPYHMLSLA